MFLLPVKGEVGLLAHNPVPTGVPQGGQRVGHIVVGVCAAASVGSCTSLCLPAEGERAARAPGFDLDCRSSSWFSKPSLVFQALTHICHGTGCFFIFYYFF